MEDTARKLLNTEILPEHTSKLDQMFDDKFATVKSHLESHFNDQLKAQAKVTSLKIKEFGWLLNSLTCLKFWCAREKWKVVKIVLLRLLQTLTEETEEMLRQKDTKLTVVENRFNEQLDAQAKVISFKIKEIGWLLNSLACLKF